MDEMFYRKSMEAEGISPNAIATRISKGNKVEEILKVDMDRGTARQRDRNTVLFHHKILVLRLLKAPTNVSITHF